MKSSKTKAHIATILIESVTEIPLRKLSVNDLCQRAEISRGAFYYHFQDINELVCWIYHNYVTIPTQALISPQGWDLSKIIGFSLDCLYQNKEFFIQAFQMDGENSLGDYAKKEVEERFRQIWQAYLSAHHRIPKVGGHMDKILDYFSNAHYYTLVSWIQDGMTVPPAEMAEILVMVSQTAIRHTLEQGTLPEKERC